MTIPCYFKKQWEFRSQHIWQLKVQEKKHGWLPLPLLRASKLWVIRLLRVDKTSQGISPPWIYPSQRFFTAGFTWKLAPPKMGKSEIPALEKKHHSFLGEAFVQLMRHHPRINMLHLKIIQLKRHIIFHPPSMFRWTIQVQLQGCCCFPPFRCWGEGRSSCEAFHARGTGSQRWGDCTGAGGKVGKAQRIIGGGNWWDAKRWEEVPQDRIPTCCILEPGHEGHFGSFCGTMSYQNFYRKFHKDSSKKEVAPGSWTLRPWKWWVSGRRAFH